MTSKREVLLAICETPGWSPSNGSSASIDRSLEELEREGWVIPRLDGFEATPAALDAYPAFTIQPDIAAPTVEKATVNGNPRDRVATLIACLLCEMPLTRVTLMLGATPEQIMADETTWALARQLAEQMFD